jgi:hypothetical protein
MSFNGDIVLPNNAGLVSEVSNGTINLGKPAQTVVVRGQFNNVSDLNLKENIVNASNSLENLRRLRVVEFSFKDEESSKPTQIGLIAQEVEEVLPNLVNVENDGVRSLNVSSIHMMMVKCIQELADKNDALEKEVKSLQEELAKRN